MERRLNETQWYELHEPPTKYTIRDLLVDDPYILKAVMYF